MDMGEFHTHSLEPTRTCFQRNRESDLFQPLVEMEGHLVDLRIFVSLYEVLTLRSMEQTILSIKGPS